MSASMHRTGQYAIEAALFRFRRCYLGIVIVVVDWHLICLCADRWIGHGRRCSWHRLQELIEQLFHFIHLATNMFPDFNEVLHRRTVAAAEGEDRLHEIIKRYLLACGSTRSIFALLKDDVGHFDQRQDIDSNLLQDVYSFLVLHQAIKLSDVHAAIIVLVNAQGKASLQRLMHPSDLDSLIFSICNCRDDLAKDANEHVHDGDS
mmetsp:Transcript_60548/g.107543  ORF Transcript_60548/g.107543 Transcript_60548/m.107543 type:complete len:205 (-) Transcript_60548:420-1034(-)